MRILSFSVGLMRTNCYFVVDEQSNNTIIIDPGDDGQYLIEKIQAYSLIPKLIIATHGHFDHIMAACEVQLTFQIPFLIHSKDTFLVKRMKETAKFYLNYPSPDQEPIMHTYLSDHDSVDIGKSLITILHVPGHTPGSIAIYCKKESVCFVGDTVFKNGIIGRTDFSYSNEQDEIQSIQKLLSLPKETILYPGHGEETTVSNERALRDNLNS